MQKHPSRTLLVIEFFGLVFGLPVLLLTLHLQKFLLPSLWLAAAYCAVVGRRQLGMNWRDAWQRRAITRANLRPILMCFFPSALALALVTYQLLPEKFFGFVQERPLFWGLIMVLYPLLSVIAQEIIYRWFFFARYAPLFPQPRAMLAASAFAFAFGHIVLNNWVAPTLCLIGGLLFGSTYLRTRSLALVSLEHGLYGDMIFTIGLGWFFYHGAVHG